MMYWKLFFSTATLDSLQVAPQTFQNTTSTQVNNEKVNVLDKKSDTKVRTPNDV